MSYKICFIMATSVIAKVKHLNVKFYKTKIENGYGIKNLGLRFSDKLRIIKVRIDNASFA